MDVRWEDDLRKLYFWLFIGTRGGRMRMHIMKALFQKPMNMHQLASELGVNYRTVEHHVRVMLKNGLLSQTGDGYGQIYFPSKTAISTRGMIEEFERELGDA